MAVKILERFMHKEQLYQTVVLSQVFHERKMTEPCQQFNKCSMSKVQGVSTDCPKKILGDGRRDNWAHFGSVGLFISVC